MKNIFLLLAIVACLVACGTAEEKETGKILTEEEKKQAGKDTSNFTTVAWLDSTYTNLGKVKEGRVVEVGFRFRNTGDKNLIIANVQPGCGCTTPEKPEKPYAPGDEGVIKVKFDSKGQHKGEHIKNVMVTANTVPSQQVQLLFRVEIID
ncbi:MAG: DUF1573 domain-containing protein [Chitinophagaceae bacterium]|nr:DUF1573 domain-containing protein [Chitinophagaceae bacterium]